MKPAVVHQVKTVQNQKLMKMYVSYIASYTYIISTVFWSKSATFIFEHTVSSPHCQLSKHCMLILYRLMKRTWKN